MNNAQYTAISLFSGAVDGLAIAAQAAGINVTHHVEWDAWCCRVLRMNHPNAIVINEDIHHVRNLPSADIIFGGSPCQDFSSTGKGAGFSGKRFLWPEMFRIVRESRPRVVIHENVRGGVSKGLLDRISDDLESEGYETKALVFPACVFGAPHERYRMFHIALLADDKSGRLPQRHPQKRQLRGVLSDTRIRMHTGKQAQSEMGGNLHGIASRLPRLNPLEHFSGFPAGQGSYQYLYEPSRTTTKKDAYHNERIQALGNAVVWQQAAPIFRAVVKWLELGRR